MVDTPDNLLSRQASCRLGILKFAGEICEDVFGEAGLMKTSPIHIQLHDNVVPGAVTTARHVPIPLLKMVEEELERIEMNGIIISVTDHGGLQETC